MCVTGTAFSFVGRLVRLMGAETVCSSRFCTRKLTADRCGKPLVCVADASSRLDAAC